MKIRELLTEEGDSYLLASPRSPHIDRREGPKVPRMPMARTRIENPDYTPGKAALDKEYKRTEEHTRTHIPNQQHGLNDPVDSTKNLKFNLFTKK